MTAATKITAIPLADVVESPTNPRKSFDKEKLAELAESIKKHGVLQPVLARELDSGDFELVYGHRRVRAAKLAGLTEIPAEVRELDDKTVLEIQVIENVQREDVHPLEEAVGYQQLVEHHKMPVEELAAKVGKSKAYIYSRLKLCSLSKKARQAFLDGKLSAAVAYLVARIPHGDLQDQALEELESYDGVPVHVDEARHVIQQQFMLDLSQAPFDTKSATLVPKAGPCATCPKRTGNQKDLFADVKSKDLCTDSKCFDAKKKAGAELAVAAAKEQGKTVLAAAEAKKALQYGSSYVKLDERCWEDPKGRSYGQLLGKKAQTVVAVGEDGAARELVPKSLLPALLKDAGHEFKAPRESSGNGDYQAQQRAREKKAKVLREAGRRAMTELVTHLVNKEPSEKLWRALTKAALGHAGADALGFVAKRRELVVKGAGWDKSAPLFRSSKDMDVAGLRGLIFEAILSSGAYPGGWSSGFGAPFREACEAAGVDLKKHQREAQKDLGAGKAAKKTAGVRFAKPKSKRGEEVPPEPGDEVPDDDEIEADAGE